MPIRVKVPKNCVDRINLKADFCFHLVGEKWVFEGLFSFMLVKKKCLGRKFFEKTITLAAGLFGILEHLGKKNVL